MTGGIVAAIIVARLLVSRFGNKKKTRSTVSFSGGYFLAWLLLAANTALAGLAFKDPRIWPACLVLAMLTWPWWFSRRFFIPLGLARPAYYLTRLSTIHFYRQQPAGACFAAALALTRRTHPKQADVAFVAGRLARSLDKKPVRSAALATQGFLHALNGERDKARAVLRSVCELSPSAGPDFVMRAALDFCLADAAERGAWPEVLELRNARRLHYEVWPHLAAWLGWVPLSRTELLMRCIARRVLTGETPNGLALWLAFWVAPRRRRTLRLVRAALAQAPRAKAPRSQTSQTGTADLGPALAAHLHPLMHARAPEPEALARLDALWCAALESPERAQKLNSRAQELGALRVDAVSERLRTLVAADFAEWTTKSLESGGAAPEGVLARESLRFRRDVCCDEADLLVARIQDRLRARSPIQALDAWHEYLTLRTVHEELGRLGGLEDRRTSFAAIYNPLLESSARMFNQDGERVLGNAMFRWLLLEAGALGDTHAAGLLRKNVLIGV